MNRLLISVTPAQHRWLKLAAANEGVSIATLVRRAIDAARQKDAQ